MGAGFCFAFALFLLRFSCDFCCVPGRCILKLLLAFSGMIFPALMHLKFAIQALRDAFRRWKSSLPEVSFKSGWKSLSEIIPAGGFLQIRMNFPVGNHPRKALFSNQDASAAPNASPTEVSVKTGWISLLKIIPARHYSQIRMHPPFQMHPCPGLPSNRDACCSENESVPNNFREKDDSKGECTARSEMRTRIKCGRKSRRKRSAKDTWKKFKKFQKSAWLPCGGLI